MTLTDSDKYSKVFPECNPIQQQRSRGGEIQIHLCEFKITSGISVRTKIINREISIEPTLLERKFSGKGFEKVPLRQILDKERKAIRKDEDSEEKGWTIIKKIIMKN